MNLADARVGVVSLSFNLDDPVAHVDDQALEVGGQEVAPDVVRRTRVEASGIDEQLQEAQHSVRGILQAISGCLQPFFDGGALQRSLLNPGADLAHRERAGCCQLDEPFFLRFELVEFFLKLGLRVPVLGEDVRHGLGHGLLHAGEDGLGKPLLCDGGHERSLDQLDANVDHRAQAPLVRRADEVLVGAAPAGVPGVQQAAGPSGIPTLAAVEHPLQVVEVTDVPAAVPLARVEHLLHPQEGLFRD